MPKVASHGAFSRVPWRRDGGNHPWTFATVAENENEGDETRRLEVASGPVFSPRRSAEEDEADDVDAGRAAQSQR